MSDQLRSPAPKWIRTAIAVAYLAIWLVAMLADFFISPELQSLPLWFQATGLVVLGYLLGISVDDLRRGGTS